MNIIIKAIERIKKIEENIEIDSYIHRLNPILKLIITVLYIVVVSSFSIYAIIALVPFIVFIYFVLLMSNLDVKDILKSFLVIEPFIIILAFFSAIFTYGHIYIFDVAIHLSVIVFFSLIIKITLTMLSVIILMSTTKSSDVFNSFLYFRVSKIFVTVLFLTYRYIWVFLDEVRNTLTAYYLRGGNSKKVKFNEFIPMIGQIFIRSYDKGKNIYNAMLLRGYDVDKNYYNKNSLNKYEVISITTIFIGFLICRIYNVVFIIGNIFI